MDFRVSEYYQKQKNNNKNLIFLPQVLLTFFFHLC